ncbi:hypothetical protein [Streptomyces sp. NBC_00989]|uniref:hypothetical protein n=1 Tax=Streptomyces sp. NBC_00989 TaxID=2903705 RepID=UPI002F915802|nr:hypothetical protein OG714_54230 [Streptomyces sp. NBC_00989]
MTAAQWVSAGGTIAATATAVWLAARQRSVQERVLAGAQREKAAHIALEVLDRDGVTVRNYGLTPITRVVVRAEVHLDEDFGPDEGWQTVERVRAHGVPRKQALLAAGDTARFTFDWSEQAVDPALRWQEPDVTYEYTDAAGTRWRRAGFDLPVPVGGVPLPGSAAEGRRQKWRTSKRRWNRRRRDLWRSLRLGVRGKGFTKKGRQKRRLRSPEEN